MNAMWKSGLMAAGLALMFSSVGHAGILDRIEAGRMQIKGWAQPRRAYAARTVRVTRPTYAPMTVVSRPGRITYSPAFQAPSADAAPAETVILVPQAPVYRGATGGGGMPSSFDRSFKGTYRNSR